MMTPATIVLMARWLQSASWAWAASCMIHAGYHRM